MLFSFGQNYAKYSFMGGKNVLIGGHVLIRSPCSRQKVNLGPCS